MILAQTLNPPMMPAAGVLVCRGRLHSLSVHMRSNLSIHCHTGTWRVGTGPCRACAVFCRADAASPSATTAARGRDAGCANGCEASIGFKKPLKMTPSSVIGLLK
jgi:hypothetical protein